jgi:hypothetical protein
VEQHCSKFGQGGGKDATPCNEYMASKVLAERAAWEFVKAKLTRQHSLTELRMIGMRDLVNKHVQPLLVPAATGERILASANELGNTFVCKLDCSTYHTYLTLYTSPS